MAILGVLLGITITVLAGVIWYVKRELAYVLEKIGFAYEDNSDTSYQLKILEERKDVIMNSIEALEGRVKVIENSKAVAAETVAPQPKASVRMRTWNEDFEAAE